MTAPCLPRRTTVVLLDPPRFVAVGRTSHDRAFARELVHREWPGVRNGDVCLCIRIGDHVYEDALAPPVRLS